MVLKALKYAPDARQRSKIIAEFTNAPSSPITKLIRHKYADVIVDTIYCVYANAQERQQMVEYFYGAEYLILKKSVSTVKQSANKGGKSGNVTLKAVLEQFPDKKERIVSQMKQHLTGMIGKEGTIGRNEILHR